MLFVLKITLKNEHSVKGESVPEFGLCEGESFTFQNRRYRHRVMKETLRVEIKTEELVFDSKYGTIKIEDNEEKNIEIEGKYSLIVLILAD